MAHLDLSRADHSYFFGFVQGDGHLSRQKGCLHKGKLEIELALRDRDILIKLKDLFPDSSLSERTRDTGLKDHYMSVTWRVCGQAFREEMEALGVPVGPKATIIAPPTGAHSVPDYWRGMIDADGSLGVTTEGLPYVSLVTASQPLADAYISFLRSITGKTKTISRNVRDGTFNIMVMREDAVDIVRALYYPGCLALDRKVEKAKEVMAWIRPVGMRCVRSARAWTAAQDRIVLTHSLTHACKVLARSQSSVSCRKVRLRALSA